MMIHTAKSQCEVIGPQDLEIFFFFLERIRNKGLEEAVRSIWTKPPPGVRHTWGKARNSYHLRGICGIRGPWETGFLRKKRERMIKKRLNILWMPPGRWEQPTPPTYLELVWMPRLPMPHVTKSYEKIYSDTMELSRENRMSTRDP